MFKAWSAFEIRVPDSARISCVVTIIFLRTFSPISETEQSMYSWTEAMDGRVRLAKRLDEVGRRKNAKENDREDLREILAGNGNPDQTRTEREKASA